MKFVTLYATAVVTSSSTISRALAFAPTTNIMRARHMHRTSNHALFADPTYGMRKTMFGIEEKGTLKDVSSNDKCIYVDVRNPDEIEQSQCCRPFVEGSYLLGDCDTEVVCKDLPDKDAHHVVFCAKGGRANKACQKLKELGYSNVYNAGGLGDIDFLE